MQILDPNDVSLKGSHLIEASAGTGKTFTITTLYMRLIVEEGWTVEQILVATFTKAATRELSLRLRAALQETIAALVGQAAPKPHHHELIAHWDKDVATKRLRAALNDADRMAVYTLHGFCQRMLQDYAFESGARLDATPIENEDGIIETSLHDDWERTLATTSPLLVQRLLADLPIGIQTRTLKNLAYKCLSNPALTITPELNTLEQQTSFDQAYAVLNSHYQTLRAAWPTARQVVLDELTSEGTKKNIFRPDSVKKWVGQIDRIVAAHVSAPAQFPEAFAKFTASNVARAPKKGFDPPSDPIYLTFEEIENATSGTERSVRVWALRYRHLLLNRVRQHVQQVKIDRGLLSFNDLLQQLDEALDDPVRGQRLAATIQTRFPAALIDECQDTDPIQLSILGKALSNGSALFMIGDPKQSIYGFRGADLFAYLEARGGMDDAHTMAVNWRSDPTLLRAIEGCFGQPRHPNPFVLTDVGFHPVSARPDAADAMEQAGAPLQLVFASRQRFAYHSSRHRSAGDRRLKSSFTNDKLPELIAQDIALYLKRGPTIHDVPVRPSDIAVLTKTNHQARELHRRLTALKVPAAMHGDTSVLETEEAGDVEALLSAMLAPDDLESVSTALSSRLIGWDAEQLLSLADDEALWVLWTSRLQDWAERWNSQGVLATLRHLMECVDGPQRLIRQVGGERALTNYLHLAELLQDVVTEHALGPAGLTQWLREARNGTPSRAVPARDVSKIRLETESGAVTIMTAHNSKGLQFPVVWLPFFPNARIIEDAKPGATKVDIPCPMFHDPENEHRLTLDVGSNQWRTHRALNERERLAEDVRLLYVGMTRAKHQVHVVWGAMWNFERSALAWILSPPSDNTVSTHIVDALAQRVGGCDDAELWGMLEALSRTSDGAIGCREIQDHDLAPIALHAETSPPVHTRELSRPPIFAERSASYSTLVRNAPTDMGGEHDHDDEASTLVVEPGDTNEVPLAEFPRGRHAGICLHELLEFADFQDSSDWPALVEDVLARHRFDPSVYADVIVESLRSMLETPLGDGAPALCAVPRKDRLDEMEFLLPTRSNNSPLRPAEMAAAFATRDDVAWASRYAEQLGRLPFAPFSGTLKGYVDLVFRHDGSFWVVDYKSNHLGNTFADYHHDALHQAMVHHHYILQAHLYVLALHRYLRWRVPDYDYERHMGGYRYAFLRGMTPERPGHGVYADRPSLACINALDHLLEGT